MDSFRSRRPALNRDRDAEFDARGGATRRTVLTNLRGTVEEAIRIIDSLNTEQMTRMYEMQDTPVSGVQAVFHVVEHFAQHTGQIIFATKMLTARRSGFLPAFAESCCTRNMSHKESS